jgi:hypothetical protein
MHGVFFELTSSAFVKDDVRRANQLYSEKFGTLRKKHNYNTTRDTRSKSAPVSGQHDIFELNIKTERKSGTMHVRYIDSLRSVSEVKDRELADVTVDIGCDALTEKQTMLRGNVRKSSTSQKSVVLYKRIDSQPTCLKCRHVMKKMCSHRVATIHTY